MFSLAGKIFAVCVWLVVSAIVATANAMPPPPQPGDTAYCVMSLKVNEVMRSKETVQLSKSYDYVPNSAEKVDMLLSEFKAHIEKIDTKTNVLLPPDFSKQQQELLEAREIEAVKPTCGMLAGKDISISYQAPYNTSSQYEYIKIFDKIIKDNRLTMECKVNKQMLEDLHLKCGAWVIWG